MAFVGAITEGLEGAAEAVGGESVAEGSTGAAKAAHAGLGSEKISKMAGNVFKRGETSMGIDEYQKRTQAASTLAGGVHGTPAFQNPGAANSNSPSGKTTITSPTTTLQSLNIISFLLMDIKDLLIRQLALQQDLLDSDVREGEKDNLHLKGGEDEKRGGGFLTEAKKGGILASLVAAAVAFMPVLVGAVRWVVDKIKAHWTEIINKASKIWDDVWISIKEKFTLLQDDVTFVFGKVKDAFLGGIGIVEKAFATIKDVLTKIKDWFLNLIPDAFKTSSSAGASNEALKAAGIERSFIDTGDGGSATIYKDTRTGKIIDEKEANKRLNGSDSNLPDEFIKKEEGGFRSRAYDDGKGNGTIGYGHLITKEEKAAGYINIDGQHVPLDNITQEQGEKIFKRDLGKAETHIKNTVGEDNWNKLNPNQQEAISSRVFNRGIGKGMPRNLKENLEKGDTGAIAKSLSEGPLPERRKREAELFNKPVPPLDTTAGRHAVPPPKVEDITNNKGIDPQARAASAVDDMIKMQGDPRDSRDLKDYIHNGGVNLDPSRAAWCAAMVNSALAHHGLEGFGSQIASTGARWGASVKNLADVQKGDVAIAMHGAVGDVGSHAVMATGRYDPQRGVETIGRNTVNGKDVVGTRWRNDVILRRATAAQLTKGAKEDAEKSKELYKQSTKPNESGAQSSSSPPMQQSSSSPQASDNSTADDAGNVPTPDADRTALDYGTYFDIHPYQGMA
jgi:lysozyme